MEVFWRDLRTALRRLRTSPGFMFTAVVSLSLGIGANTAIFGLLNALMLRPLPVVDPQRLVRIGPANSRGFVGEVPQPIFDWLRKSQFFGGLCGVSTPLSMVEVKDVIMPVGGHALSGGCYEMLGVRPALGRLFTYEDDISAGPRVVVLSFDFWRRQFGGDPKVLGQSIRIEGVRFTIIGVTEPRFQGFLLGYPVSISFPITQQAKPGRADPFAPQSFYWGFAFARLKPDATPEKAKARLNVHWRRLLDESLPTSIDGSQRREMLNEPLVVSSASTGLDY
jgi:putative ABC transport system permease protein